MMRCDETEKRGDSAWMRGPSATTRRKARRASQPNAGARHHCLRAWMPELVPARSVEHTSELQSLMRSSYAVFCLKTNTHLHTKALTLQKQSSIAKLYST